MPESHERKGLYGTLKEALIWWYSDVQFMTTGDYGEYNAFDEDPQWVKDACKLLNTNEQQILEECQNENQSN